MSLDLDGGFGPGIFISHTNDEAPVADALKVYLKRCFGQDFRVFVASDYDSIPTGEDWYRAIVTSVVRASAVIILLSRHSVDRRWINFEAGIAIGAGRPLLPFAIRGLQPIEVGLPLSHRHIRQLSDAVSLEALVRDVAELTKSPLQQDLMNAESFAMEINDIQARLPVKGILLEPFIHYQRGQHPLLRVKLSNTGNMDVELIELEVCIPRAVILPNWTPINVPNIICTELLRDDDTELMAIRETPFDGAVDARYGAVQPLPRVISPYWTPRLSSHLRVPLKEEETRSSAAIVRYKVVARGVFTEVGRIRLRDIPAL
jgi:hypothetical protein